MVNTFSPASGILVAVCDMSWSQENLGSNAFQHFLLSAGTYDDANIFGFRTSNAGEDSLQAFIREGGSDIVSLNVKTQPSLVKIFIEYRVIKKGSVLIFDKSILNVFLPAEILHIPYIVIAGISSTVGNYTWKGRKIRR